MAASRLNAKNLTADQMCTLLKKAGIHPAESAAVAAAAASAAASKPTYILKDNKITVGNFCLEKIGTGTNARWITQQTQGSDLVSWDFLADNQKPSALDDTYGDVREGQRFCQSSAECGYAALVQLLVFVNPAKQLLPEDVLSSLLDDGAQYESNIPTVIEKVNAAIQPAARTAATLGSSSAAATTLSTSSPAAIAKQPTAAPTTTPSERTPRDLTNDDLQKLIVAAGIATSTANAGDYILDFDMIKAGAFKSKVESQINLLGDKAGTLHFLVNTRSEPADKSNSGASAHWLHIQLDVNEKGRVTKVYVDDSNTEDNEDTKTIYKDKILSGLSTLKNSDATSVHFYDINITQTAGNSCGYCALASFAGKIENSSNNDFHQMLKTNDDEGYAAADTSDQEKKIISKCNQKLDSLRATAAPAAPTSSTSSSLAPEIDENSDLAIDCLLNAAGYDTSVNYNISLAHRESNANNWSIFRQVVGRRVAPVTNGNVDFILNTADAESSNMSHFVHLQLAVTNGHVTGITVFDSLPVTEQDKDKYKDQILKGLTGLFLENSPPKYQIKQGILQPRGSIDCPYYAFASLVSQTNTEMEQSGYNNFRENINQSFWKIKSAQSGDSQPAKSSPNAEALTSLCHNKIQEAHTNRQAQPRPPSSSSGPTSSSSSSSTEEDTESEVEDESISDEINKILDDTRLTPRDKERAFNKYLDIYPPQTLERLNRALIASVNQYVELKLSEHSDTAKLKLLKDAINDLKKQLEDARDTLKALQSHTDKISPNKQQACEADLRKRLAIAENALSRISKFEQAKRVTDGWLHASILTESKAILCDSYESACQEAGRLLNTTTTAPMGSLNLGESLQTTGKKDYTVFKMTVKAQDETVINSAVIRTVDRNAGTIKSEFHFNTNELDAFKNNDKVDSAIMEMVAQNVKNFRAPMLATDVNKPIRLNVGNPPMPSNFIDGYILYCAFKGYQLEVTPHSPDYKKAQDNMDKPGWFGFGNESKVDRFAKAWKIKHPDDVGIKEQQKLEAAVALAKRP